MSGSAAIGLSAVVAVLVTGTAGAVSKSNSGPACYPSNNMGMVAGTGWIGMDATADTNVEVDNVPGFDPNTDYPGTAHVHLGYQVSGQQTNSNSPDGSTLNGHVKIEFTIGQQAGTFVSDCIQEAQTEASGIDEDTGKPETDAFESEFEGMVTGFPGKHGAQHAVATVDGHNANGQIVLKFAIELGKTGHEGPPEIGVQNQTKNNDHQKTSGTLSSGKSDSGACSSTSSTSNSCAD